MILLTKNLQASYGYGIISPLTNMEKPGWFEKNIKGTVVSDKENASRLLIHALGESSRFFDKDIAIPEVPDQFYKTQERLREIGFTRAEPLVLPQRTLLQDDRLWEGRVQPRPWFWGQLRKGNLRPESAIMQQGIYLIDGRPKPECQDGQQGYEDDAFMEEMIGGLRRKGIVSYRKTPDNSRFGISHLELEEVILPEFARVIGKDALGSKGKVVNNTFMIFNLVGNMRHPEWGDTNTDEWFGDTFKSDTRLIGGHSCCDGLANATIWTPDYRLDRIGFRPLIAFTSKT